ncbi:acyltransferase [Microbacterium marinum]|uniref:acyltransferase family protein n=1 Tax=Microbacterium marinum TaxID=421115 RepID=UPI003850C3DE
MTKSVADKGLRRELQGVQFLRAIAVLLVVANHTLIILAGSEYFGSALIPQAIAEKGAVGVDLFFVVSGFIIAYVSLTPDTLSAKVTVSRFIKKRLVRIVPLLWVAVLLFALFRYVATHDVDVASSLNAMFVLPVGEQRPNVVWTLRHEFLFYALFAVSFLSLRGLRWVVYTWALSPLIVWPFLPALEGVSAEWARLLVGPSNVNFAVGLTVGLLYLRFRSLREAHISQAAAIAAIVVGVGGMVAARDALPVPFSALGGALAIFGAIFCASRSDLISRGLDTVGDASYAIYLTHNLGILATAALWDRFFGPSGQGYATIVVFAVAVGAGVLVHFFVETPLIDGVNRFLSFLDRRTRPRQEGSRPDRRSRSKRQTKRA